MPDAGVMVGEMSELMRDTSTLPNEASTWCATSRTEPAPRPVSGAVCVMTVAVVSGSPDFHTASVYR